MKHCRKSIIAVGTNQRGLLFCNRCGGDSFCGGGFRRFSGMVMLFASAFALGFYLMVKLMEVTVQNAARHENDHGGKYEYT